MIDKDKALYKNLVEKNKTLIEKNKIFLVNFFKKTFYNYIFKKCNLPSLENL